MPERPEPSGHGPPWARWHEQGGGGGPWGRRPAPPWWPQGEPWPPRHGPGARAWSSFGRRMLRVVVLVVSVPVVLGLLLGLLAGGTDGLASVALVWLLIGAVVVGAAAVLIRTWGPIRGLIVAAGRLADGDHSARAPEPGTMMTRPVVSSFNRMAARLEHADAQRRQLLADVGHELRTPLTVLRGDLEAMVDGVRPVDEEHVRTLLDDVEMVERLLDDLRTLSLAESGALVLDTEPTDLVRLTRDVVDRLEGVAAAAGVAVRVGGDGAPVGDVDLDPVRIREVVSNLVVNAIGATPAGGAVTVGVREEDHVAVVTVADTGVGIPDDEVAAVFERFHKGSGSSGTGLGLTISRDLVTAHGGTLRIASTSPAGTTMRVELPRA